MSAILEQTNQLRFMAEVDIFIQVLFRCGNKGLINNIPAVACYWYIIVYI